MTPGAEPALRRAPIPLREPQAAVTVNPLGAVHPPATHGTLALALGWDTVDADSPQPPLPVMSPVIGPVMSTVRNPMSGPVISDVPCPPEPGRRRGSRPAASAWPARQRPANQRPASAARRARDDRRTAAADQLAAQAAGATPDARDWAAGFAQAAMEVATGMRPATQLIRWTTPDIQLALARRGALSARAVRRASAQPAKPRLRALRLGTPAFKVCEVAAVMAGPDKVRALAFRMEGFQGRWRVTELEMG